MERRLLLVFALTFLVGLLFRPLLQKYLPQAPQAPQKEAQGPPTGAPATAVPAIKTQPSLPVEGTKQASGESETVAENDVYRITFSNRGGVVKSWVVKKYDD